MGGWVEEKETREKGEGGGEERQRRIGEVGWVEWSKEYTMN